MAEHSDGHRTSTIVFTDLAGSTAQRVELGEESADDLRRVHDQLLIDASKRQSGHIVSGGGDGMMIAFDAATDALRAAVEIQQAIDDHNHQPGRLATLSIRVGVSTGDVAWEDGDAFGMPVIEAARLEAAAEPGTILCSAYTQVATRGRGGFVYEFVDNLDLKGIPEPVPAFRVLWEPSRGIISELPSGLRTDDTAGLVGRTVELERAQGFLGHSTRTRVLWLTGESGIGKTRLASELARQAHHDGWAVLFGHADAELKLPLGPIVEALRPVAPDAVGLVTELIPDDAVEYGARSTDGELTSQQYRIFERVRNTLADLAARQPVLIVLDDLHWATGPTIQLLRYLLTNVDDPGPTVVATIRDGESMPPLDALRALVASTSTSLEMALQPLSVDEIAELVETDHVTASAVHGESAGNPLMARLLGTRSAAHDRSDLGWLVDRRLNALPVNGRRLLHAAALSGVRFDLRLAADATGLDHVQALDLLETACALGVLTEEEGFQFRFVHPMLRSALSDELGASRSALLHHQLAVGLQRAEYLPPDEQVARLAHHAIEAARSGHVLENAVALIEAAASQASERAAYTDAVDFLDRAVQLSLQDERGPSQASAELMLRSAAALTSAGQFRAAQQRLREVAEQANAAGWPGPLARAAIQFQEANAFLGQSTPEARRYLERAYELLDPGETAIRARVLARLATSSRFLGELQAARDLATQALALAEFEDDPALLLDLSQAVRVTHREPGDANFRIATATRALDNDRPVDFVNYAYWDRAVSLIEIGDFRKARADTNALERSAIEHHEPFMRTLALRLDSVLLFLGADYEGAAAAAQAAADLDIDRGSRDDGGSLGIQMYLIRRAEGRLSDIGRIMQMILLRGDADRAWAPGLANLCCELGDAQVCRRQIERVCVDGDLRLRDDDRKPLALALLADPVSFLDDRRLATSIAEQLEPHRGTWLSMAGVACGGPAELALGILKAGLGDIPGARRELTTALDLSVAAYSPTYARDARRRLARVQ